MKRIFISFIMVLLLLSGCTSTGPSISAPTSTPIILPTITPEPTEILSVPSEEHDAETTKPEEKKDLTQLQTDLMKLTKKPRPVGSEGEAEAVLYLKERLEKMGYMVSLKEYISESGAAGNNVEAVRKSSVDGDILVISAHHDSFATSFGANDNASGVAALLLVAERLANVDTDTELRFISFTDEEGGKNGSREYVESISEEERSRIIGCIQFDMLGGLGSSGTMLCTTDGTSNWLCDLLMDQDSKITLGIETASDHSVFQLAGIPSLLVMQKGQGYLYHSIGDTMELLDLETIYDAASMVGNIVEKIVSIETGSYREIAKEQAGNYFYRQQRQSRIFYSASRAENEAYLGFTGELVDEWEIKDSFWCDKYEVYQYDMGWFGGEKLMPTQYIYRNGFLDSVKIHPAESDYTMEELCSMITATHGEPRKADAANYRWEWQDELYSKYISLYVEDGKSVISVGSFSIGISNTIATYDVVAGESKIENTEHTKVWDLLCTAIPAKYRQKIGQFQIFSDGFGGILAYTAPVEEAETTRNTEFCITVDYYDVYDEYGNARDWSDVLYTLIHEYGHVLLENDTQIDLSVGTDTHDPAGFIEGTFRQKYYEKFWKDPYHSFLGTYEEKPDNYVSRYAANVFHEDIADTFAVFVFSSKPDGGTVAEEKLLYFWDDTEMVTLRNDIRAGLGLD